jgi:iron-sulfur cluster repair protein YtfE (RIC family)
VQRVTRWALMDAVCAELKMHTRIEEEIFYPALRKALPDDQDLLNEAEVEHAAAKDLIEKIENGSAAARWT